MTTRKKGASKRKKPRTPSAGIKRGVAKVNRTALAAWMKHMRQGRHRSDPLAEARKRIRLAWATIHAYRKLGVPKKRTRKAWGPGLKAGCKVLRKKK